MRVSLLVLAALAASATAAAQEQPIVRVDVAPETVNVGESAELTVTILVPTFFTRPSIYPSFELSNAITRLPANSSYNVRERIGNQTWPGTVRTYEVYPLLGAAYRLSGQDIEVTYANPEGGDPLTATVGIPEVVFRGRIPAGAESLDPYVAGRSLDLSLEVEGNQQDLQVGDALVLTYVAELDGLPAIFIPPLAPALTLDGVSVYADAADLEEEASSPARRREKLTLVFDGGGEFELPGVAMDFFNTDTSSIETASVGGLSVSVAGPPAARGEPGGATRSAVRIVLLAAGVVLLLLLARWASRFAAVQYRDAAERRQRSEAFAFEEFRNALQSGNARASYRAMLTWLDRLSPTPSAREFARAFGDAPFSRDLDDLIRGLYDDSDAAADYSRLASEAVDARRRYLAQASTAVRASLPPLNP